MSAVAEPAAQPARAEILNLDQLADHARAVGASHARATAGGPRRPFLEAFRRTREELLAACRQIDAVARARQELVPAEEWLVDNFYIVEVQLREIVEDLPRGYLAELPHLRDGPHAGYPRVYALALDFIAHTDARLDRENLRRYVESYQESARLTIGELWAIPIMLRVSLVENLRRLASQELAGREERARADSWADRLIARARERSSDTVIALADLAESQHELSDGFVMQLLKRLRDQDAPMGSAFVWIDERLAELGTSAEEVIRRERHRQSINQVSVGNSITSMRVIGALDWAGFFERVSLVERELRADPAGAYAAMDPPSRDLYRHRLEDLAKRSPVDELEVARQAVALAREGERTDEPASERAGEPPSSPVRRSAGPPVRGAPARETHVGYYLIDAGAPRLEALIGYRSPFSERLCGWIKRHPLVHYLGWIGLFTALLVAVPLLLAVRAAPQPGSLVLVALLLAVPASEVAISVVNLGVSFFFKPRILPKLLLRDGIPDELRTLVVVPTILTSPGGVRRLAEDLEIRYLANQDPNLSFALLTDVADAPGQEMPADAELIELARERIEELNRRHGQGRFYLLHRRRAFNLHQDLAPAPSPHPDGATSPSGAPPRPVASVAPSGSGVVRGCWMGWERKRGKLEELSRLLRAVGSPAATPPRAADTSYDAVVGDPAELVGVRYVITLDSDTQLPRDAARRMVGTLAHPLNRAVFDPARQRVVAGYGLVQPRVSTTLTSSGRSLFARIFTGNTGLDPYTTAVSDVHQDLFGEGSYFGKALYDVDVFTAALEGRVPENRLLSHDLFEGCFVRVGLATEIELLDDHPSHYAVYSGRQHRWVRGDWQLLPWLMPRVPVRPARPMVRPGDEPTRPNDLPGSGRWKLFDNLRRSLFPPAVLALLAAGWTVLPGAPALWTAVALSTVAFPIFGHVATALLRGTAATWTSYFRGFWGDLRVNMLRSLTAITFLVDQSLVLIDAIGRTLWRLYVARRNLLEWETAAASERRLRGEPQGARQMWRRMWTGSLVALLIGLAVALVRPGALPVASPLILLWFAAPSVAAWISQPTPRRSRQLDRDATVLLRRTARKTWRFFETFVTAEDNWLPPDNWQEDPKGVLARRTSPTNIGLYLISVLAARDFGYLGLGQLAELLENTLGVIERLDRYRGHLYNWYDTATLAKLPPLYVSTVDSGNLVGHLMTIAQGCRELLRTPVVGPGLIEALVDEMALLREALRTAPAGPPDVEAKALEPLAEALRAARAAPPTDLDGWRALAADLLARAQALPPMEGRPLAPGPRSSADDVAFWTTALVRHLREVRRELDALAAASPAGQGRAGVPTLSDLAAAGSPEAARLAERLEALAQRAEEFADETDFGLVYDRDLDLFSIGFNVATGQRDGSSYDLLASEARLASFVAIARGDVPQSHWFRLGRGLTRAPVGRALLSWSGTMFEYLMPLLIMRTYWRTLLDETYQAVVARQIEYGRRRGVPWGTSESAYNTLDLSLNYQYQAFGVPGLGLKPGLAEDLVIAPYATLLAAMVAPVEAVENLRHLQREGMDGAYGFYEAKDYTTARNPPDARGVLVRNYMAHHQGMALVALDNMLNGDPMVRRFHADPRVRATELLLQERVPGPVDMIEPSGQEVPREGVPGPTDLGPTERLGQLDAPVPNLILLSNGGYSTVVTASGAGASSYRDLALTRWREDGTLDRSGSFVYLRDLATGEVWSSTFQPMRVRPEEYSVSFTPEAVRFRRRDGQIETFLEVVVSPEHAAEVRKLTVVNHAEEPVALELTSYAEIAFNGQAADLAHPAFGNLFVETAFDAESGALLLTRRPRTSDEPRRWLAHVSAVEGRWDPLEEYETSRPAFLGRGRDASNPRALRPGARLTNTTGAVLDPCLSLRRRVTLRPRARASVSFVTLVAESRQAAVELASSFADPRSIARAFELAWTDARVELRHLGVNAQQAHRFMDLTASVFFNDRARRAPPEVIARNGRQQSNLWAYGISGDRPIVLVRVDDAGATDLVHELLVCHEYWRLNSLSADLVVLNEHQGGYLQPVQDALIRMVQSSPAQGHLDQPGGIFVRRADQIADEDRDLLQAVARVVLSTSKGRLARQLVRPHPESARPTRLEALPPPERVAAAAGRPAAFQTDAALPRLEDLLFWNGLGGFTPDGREYVIDLGPGQSTPAPWANVVANPDFGFLVSEAGSGFTWQGNSQSNRLTPWSNDPVSDPPGEAIYLRDEDGAVWSPTPRPAGDGAPYRVRHGQGYTRFEHVGRGLESELLLFVPTDDPVKVWWLRLRNRSGRRRRLSATVYVEWVLGTTRERAAAQVVTERDPMTGALFARNRYADPFHRIAFLAAGPPAAPGSAVVGWTGDRTEFLGRNGSRRAPAALRRSSLLGIVGPGLDPCGALQVAVELGPDEEREVVFLLGQGRDFDHARELIRRYESPAEAQAALEQARARWDELLGAVEVRTPDRALDLMVNRWLLYQDLCCRFWARSAFYQSGGAYGFRDQLQDVMAFFFARAGPALGAEGIAREHILRAAARQFLEGDVQHWWHPETGQGVRTRYSDDLLWLPYVTAAYVQATGDRSILEEEVPFLELRQLEPHEHDLFALAPVSSQRASLYEHCLRAIRKGTTAGPHGLPLIGSGDWNDGMNRVGEGGRGESVWLGWFLARVLLDFAPLCELMGEGERAAEFRAQARRLGETIDAEGWDGAWYRRAYFDDGTPLGSAQSDECKIDAIAQSWSVIAGVGDPARARQAMRSLDEHLIDREKQLLLLLKPPFDRTPHDPGYIKGYVPGVRENGGQYTHGAIWSVWATALLGQGTRAHELFTLLNPINHAATPEGRERYKAEPYVVAADVYAAPQHVGRGGWSWYTGSAGWLYRLAVEMLLGLELCGDRFALDPTIPSTWPGFELTYRRGATVYRVRVENPLGVERGVARVELDGRPLAGREVPLRDDGQEHTVRVLLGRKDADGRPDQPRRQRRRVDIGGPEGAS
ncbi:MAG TPA: glucoamylase family protein [Chloroflexota bacterium]|nr:glucoamylase family protein [Chloroflexota bacterium]